MSSQAGKIFEKVVVLPKSRSSLLKIHEIVVLAYIIVHFMSCPQDFQKVYRACDINMVRCKMHISYNPIIFAMKINAKYMIKIMTTYYD